MSVNFTNDSHPHVISSYSLDEIQCSQSIVGRYTLTAISFTYILFVLPFSIFILYLGFQQWCQQRSVSSVATMTHSDFFTYNMAVMELIGSFGYAFHYCSSYTNLPDMPRLGTSIGSFIWPGQTLFPILICVERYLAVVHPITYRGLKQAVGVRIRNISTGCVWLSCFVWIGFLILLNIQRYYKGATAALMLVLSLMVMVFCSLSVVRVLIRPRPGTEGRNSAQVDQSKERAVRTILIIMAVLWLKFCGNVIVIGIHFSSLMYVKCVGEAFTFMFFLPCDVVLPLLFLHRAGKLPKCKHDTGSG